MQPRQVKMSSNGNALDKTRAATPGADFSAMEDWLGLETAAHIAMPRRAAVVAWCEAHAGPILVGANVLLWGSVVCGVQFGG